MKGGLRPHLIERIDLSEQDTVLCYPKLKQDIFPEILVAAGTVDVLYAGALLEAELRLAVGTADIAVGLEIPHLHVLALEEVGNRRKNTDEAVVLIQALIDVGRQRPQNGEQDQQQNDDHKDRTAHEKVDQVQHARNDPYKGVQLIVAVSAVHERGGLLQKITHILTKAFLVNCQLISVSPINLYIIIKTGFFQENNFRALLNIAELRVILLCRMTIWRTVNG